MNYKLFYLNTEITDPPEWIRRFIQCDFMVLLILILLLTICHGVTSILKSFAMRCDPDIEFRIYNECAIIYEIIL